MAIASVSYGRLAKKLRAPMTREGPNRPRVQWPQLRGRASFTTPLLITKTLRGDSPTLNSRAPRSRRVRELLAASSKGDSDIPWKALARARTEAIGMTGPLARSEPTLTAV